MNTENILLFDNEGFLLNSVKNDNLQTYKKIINPNELGSYNSISLHLFEKIDSNFYNINAKSDIIKHINDNEIIFQSGNQSLKIDNIEKLNTSNLFKTKWIYAKDINKYTSIGSYISISGLTGLYSEKTLGKLNYYPVLDIKRDAVLIQIGDTNNIALPSFTFNNTTLINVLSCMRVLPENGNINPSNNLYVNRVFTVSNTTKNDGEYFLKDICNNRTIKRSTLRLNNQFNKINININFYTNRIILYNGIITIFANKTLEFQDGIPGNLKVGDEFFIEDPLLNPVNTQLMIVTKINTSTSSIEFSAASTPIPQTLSVILGLTKINLNFTYDSKSNYNNTVYDANVTTAYISTELNKYINKVLKANYKDDYLIIESLYEGDYWDVTFYIDNTLTTSTITNPTSYLYIADGFVNEKTNVIKNKLNEKILVNKPIAISLELNNTRYTSDDLTTITDIVNNFYSKFNNKLINKFGINLIKTTNTLEFVNNSNIPNEFIPIRNISTNILHFRYVLTVNNIFNNISINIDGVNYTQQFNTNVNTTLLNWYNTHNNNLNNIGIWVKLINNTLEFYTVNRYSPLSITVNVGVSTRINENLYSLINIDDYNEPVLIVSNNLLVNNINPLLVDLYVGQSLSLSGLNNYNDKKYIINSLTQNSIGLSYQGDFPIINTYTNLKINTDTYLRYPSTTDNKESLFMTIDGGFFVDLDGYQAILQQKIPYTGNLPMWKWMDKFVLNEVENLSFLDAANPAKQKNVYDKLLINLANQVNDVLEPSSPINIHIGILNENDIWINTELNLYRTRDVNIDIISNVNNSNLVTFVDNKIVLSNFTGDLSSLKIGDTYRISYKDSNNLNSSVLYNNDKVFTITDISGYTIWTDTHFISEQSVIQVPKSTYPYVDDDNNIIYETKALHITFKFEPQLIKKINLLSETNSEDDRLKVRLNNIGRNINIKDLNILRDYNNDEYNIKWSVLNQKRKEMIEVHPDIFDKPSTYSALDAALKFWGYRDLKLFEYFINNKLDSGNFGKLKPIEKSGFNTKYVWPNDNKTNDYIKTNKISLGYRITDIEGNYIESVDLKSLQSKLFKLKQWLNDNVISTANLVDISGYSSGLSKLYYARLSNISTGIESNVKCELLDFNVKGYNTGILSNPNNYNIFLEFVGNSKIKEFSFNVFTFYVETWEYYKLYLQDKIVKYNGKFWKARYNNLETPDENSPAWIIVKNPTFNYVRTLTIVKSDFSEWSINLDNTVENMMIVKTYSFMDGKLNILSKTIELGVGVWPV